jgi:excisionase family DNA binding protein
MRRDEIVKKRTTSGSEGPLAYSVEEAARIAGIGRNGIYNSINAGQLVARKLGQRTLVLRADLEAFLANLPRMGADHA